MGKNMKRLILALCVLALCISTMGMAVYAESTVKVSIPVQIVLTGTEPAEPDTFVVEIAAADPAYPMPADAVDGVSTIEIVGASTGTIDIEFNKLGVYEYTVKQIAGTNGDCYYDDAVYHVEAYVTNSVSGSGYDLAVVVYKDSETDKCDIVFSNRYADPDEVVVSAVKTLDGKTPADGAFSFELLDSEGKLVQTVKNAGQSVTFEPMSYYEAGTYQYQLKEVVGSDAKIIYDKSVYDVTVEVTKDEEGNYVAELSYAKGDKALESAPTFANKTKTVTPATGESSTIYVMGSLMAVSAIAIAALLFMMKKKQKLTEETAE